MECTCPGQSYKHLFPRKHTHPPTHARTHTLRCAGKQPSALVLSWRAQPKTNKHTTQEQQQMKQQSESIAHLSRRRRCGLSPASSPPGRCSGPCAPAEPWGCRAWTCRPPSSRRAPWAAPPAATAWPWRRGTAARRERPATPPGAGRPARWRAWRRLRRGEGEGGSAHWRDQRGGGGVGG